MLEFSSRASPPSPSVISHFSQPRPQLTSRPPVPEPMETAMSRTSPTRPPQEHQTDVDREFLDMIYRRDENNSPDANADISSDSAVSTSSGRTSNAYSDFRDYVRSRRQTITSRLPISRIMAPLATTAQGSPRKLSSAGSDDVPNAKKPSIDSQFFDCDIMPDDPDINPFAYQRRMSVPERTLLSANYAILRKNSIDRRFEIVGAFHKHQCEAYKNFLRALTCYDLAPQHGMIITLDASLTIHKAVSLMCLHHNSGNRAAIVCNAKNRDKNLGIFTFSDCLKCLQAKAEEHLGDKSLQYYLDSMQCKKKMVTVSTSASVWDVSRLFRLNRVHRIPVFEESEYGPSNEILSFVCLRAIFVEILKLIDSKCALTPNLHTLTLDTLRLGTWTNIAWISHNATCGEAITKFLNRKVSCLPLLDDDQNFVGSLTKDHVIEAIAQHSNNYLEVLDLKVQSIIRVDEIGAMKVASPETSVEETIRMLVYNVDGGGFRQCLFVVREKSLLGVVSYADIMEFLLNSNSIS
ncbi:5'-AMP-activated protein kinase subunit gamma-2 [Ditylenchus destructor]|nr:5'-AMP-activated protein kinase subunit gamma-2 [Ditylenchus destructor]